MWFFLEMAVATPENVCFPNVSAAVVGTERMGSTRGGAAAMYEKLVFPSYFNDFPLIVRF